MTVGAPDTECFRPRILDPANSDDARALAELLDAPAGPVVHDTLPAQLRDLVTALHPQAGPDDVAGLARDQLAGRDPRRYGRWVHYPWSNRLVHILPPDEFGCLRGNRNRHRITAAEQAQLRRTTIGVVGLSVGQASVLTMVMEGVGGRFRIADSDTLDLSNLNRLRAGLHDLGLRKTVVAARAMVEIDPYLDVEVFHTGIDDENMDRFLLDGGPLDLLVEECDDIYMKMALRERARALRMPVVMETSDRGMLDVERFDLEPERPVLHGLLAGVHAAGLRGLTAAEKVPYVLRIVDDRRVSPEAAASLIEVKETIHTWPQLASAVTLGSAVLTDAARRILLGQFRGSGRYYVDLQQIVSDAATWSPTVEPEPTSAAGEGADREVIAVPERVAQGPLTRGEAEYLAAHATLAPSGGNAQPWRFVFHDGVCDGYLDTRGAVSALDPDGLGGVLAVGAAAENLGLAAGALGLDVRFDVFPDPDQPALVFRACLRRGPVRRVPELDWVPRRTTNRRPAPWQPLTSEQVGSLRRAAAARGLRLGLLTDPSDLRRLGNVLGAGDRLRFMSEPLRRELLGELRWTPDEAARTRTGIDIATLELPADQAAAMGLLRRDDVMSQLRRIGGGARLEKGARDTLAATSAVGLLTIADGGPDAFFHGGRGVEHMWLVAISLGLAVHPYTALLYLFRHLDRPAGSGLTATELSTLTRLRQEFGALFDHVPEAEQLFLFRLSHAGPPSTRVRKLPLSDTVELRDL